ncbi:gluconokinase [Streptomyces sp. MS191]|uniref:gluconokinase n=1 Tax=Streptomyces sp. ms191 TaxID=1827978 RepID=UPI0021C8DE66|nr:gluconokinase, GntK/IdnK-type [Streptomyces sp. ms191]
MAPDEMTGRPPGLVLVVGVSGAGKSTVGRLLAERLGWTYRDADEFHSEANRTKMAAGHALTDSDRAPWLEAIGEWMDRAAAAGERAVVACSALKRAYRDTLLAGRADALLVYLHGTPDLLRSRLAARDGHFFPADLLDSQLADLQEPQPDEHPLVVEIDQPPEAVVSATLTLMRRESAVGSPAEGPHAERAGHTVAGDGSPASAGPTGASWRLVRGEQSAEVVQLGGALRDYTVGGRPLLDGFSTGSTSFHEVGPTWAVQIIVPLWYLRAYLWYVLLSPLMLWALRRFPVVTLFTPLARLADALTRHRAAEPESLADALLLELLPAGGATDDTALVIVRL